jgi:hypothetical protein
MIEYNLNKTVYARLNNIGRDIYKNYIQSLNSNLSTELEVDENGFTKFQLWDLIHIFGEYINLGLPTPFDKNCIYFKEMN